MAVTTIKLEQETKSRLDEFRQSKNESYDEVVNKLVFIAATLKKEPELSIQTVKEIEEARKRIKKGHFYTEKEMRKRLKL